MVQKNIIENCNLKNISDLVTLDRLTEWLRLIGSIHPLFEGMSCLGGDEMGCILSPREVQKDKKVD